MKKVSILLFLITVFCFTLVAQVTQLRISYRPGANTLLTLTDSSMLVSSVDSSYKQACLKLTETGYSKFVAVEKGRIYFKLPQLQDGVYSVILYMGTELYGTVWSFIDKGLHLRVAKGKIHFELPQKVLTVNQEVMGRNYYPEKLLQATADIQCDEREIRQLAKEITAGCASGYDKVKAIHDYVATHIFYHLDAFYAGHSTITDALGVLHNKKTVCQGFANLAAALLRAVSIPCDVVRGYGLGLRTSGVWDAENVSGISNHAWNFAYPDNRLVVFDCTWDSDLEYKNGVNNFNRGLRGYRYFDLTPEALSLDHRLIP